MSGADVGPVHAGAAGGADGGAGDGGAGGVVDVGAVVAWLHAFAADVAAHRDELTELDAAIGDADHGVNMDRGMQAVLARLPAGQAEADADGQAAAEAGGQAAADTDGEAGAEAGGGPPGGEAGGRPEAGPPLGPLFKTAGMALVSSVGGAAGPLYGTLFLEMGKAAGDRPTLTAADWAQVVAAGVAGVQARGKAEAGDKTMVDALLPASEALCTAAGDGAGTAAAARAAADAAAEGMRATIPLVARKGRASYLGERSAGHQDPGATSSWLLLEAAARVLSGGAAGASSD